MFILDNQIKADLKDTKQWLKDFNIQFYQKTFGQKDLYSLYVSLSGFTIFVLLYVCFEKI